MAKYNDFIGTLTNGSYGDGVTTPVPGFTRRYAVGSVVTYTVNADPLSPSGKSLKIKHNATNNRTGLTVDALNSDAGRTNLELIALVRNNWSAVATTNYGGLSAGMSGTTTSNNVGIFLAAGRDGASGMSVRVGYYPTLNPNQNLVGALPHYTLGTPFWLRLVLNGLNYQLYAYTESDLRGTPVATYSGVRPSDNADNWAGLFSFIANTDLDVLYLSAGTGGDAAPSPYDVAAPISFSGSIANQTFIEGQAVDVNFASLFAGSSTPFAFANAGASIAALGLSINSAGRLVGTAVQGQVTGVIVRGTDASAATANSNAFSVTVQSLLPQGVVTINSVTPTHNAAAITFSYNAADQTGYEYRINGGASVSAGSASPLNLNGFSASTPYSIEIRAVNANGNGNWSAPFNFSTTAAPLYPPDGIVTIAGVTPAQNTASVAFSYNDTDQTGFQYRLNGGAAASAGTSSPYILTGLSASTVYDVELRAINADGNGPWSSPVQFTTAAAIPPLTLDSVFDLSNVSSVNSTIANAASASPLVYMTPRAVSISVAINWRQFAAKFTNAAGKRPIFRHNRNNLDTPGTDPLSTWTPCWTTDFVTFHHAPSWSSPADKSYFEWQFTMPFDANADTVYILSSPMYPQWQSDTFTQEILATYGTVVTPTAVAVSAKTANPAWPTGAIFVTNALNDYPTESGEAMSNVNLGSLPIYGLKFDWGTTLGATTDGGPKRKAVLMYGQHAQGEAQASISFYGALRWLLSSADAAAVALRRNFVFYVYYNINGSGIKGGQIGRASCRERL